MKLIWMGNFNYCSSNICLVNQIIDLILAVKMFESNCLNGRHEFLM